MARALEHAQALVKGQGKELESKVKTKQSEIARLESEERNLLAFIRSAGLNADDGKTPASIMEDLGSLRERITKTRAEVEEIETRRLSESGSRIDPAAVRDSLNFFDTLFDLLSPEEKGQLLKTFIQRVTYSLEKVQLRVFDEPLDGKTKEGLEVALLAPEPAGVSSAFLSRNKWLPG